MVRQSYHSICPFCKREVVTANYRVVAHDLGADDGVPQNVLAHAECVRSSGYRGCAVLRGHETIGDLLRRALRPMAATAALFLLAVR